MTVQVEQPASVDVQRAAVQEATNANVEPSMTEYANARMEADQSGKSIQSVLQEKAAATETEEPAAATEESAAAAEEANTVESATEDTQEEQPGQVEESKPKKSKGIEKRLGELTAEREAARREAEEAKALAETARKEAEEAKAEAARIKAEAEAKVIPLVPKAEDDPAPDREAFDDPDQYSAAVAAHAAREAMREANKSAEAAQAARVEEARKAAEAAQQVAIQTQIAELHKSFNEKVEKAATEYPDFAEKVTNNEKLQLRNDVFFTIEKAEMAPHLLYHLANNPTEAASLNNLSPYDAAIRIGELQAEIKIARKPQISKAAEPVKPVNQRASPERKTPDEETMEEYAARREAEERASRAQKSQRVSAVN